MSLKSDQLEILLGVLVISRFGFEGRSWVPIDSDLDLCILFTFNAKNIHVCFIITFS